MKDFLIKKLSIKIQSKVNNIYRPVRSFLISALIEKFWLLDWIPASKKDAMSVMLVRLDVIGDFILWLDSAKAYRILFPDKKLVLYANSSWAELASQFPYWDEVVSVDMNRLRSDELYRFDTLYIIHRRGFNVAVQPTYSREYMGDMLLRASSAKVRIGYQCDLSNITLEQKLISDCWYTILISSNTLRMMELKRNAEFVRALGYSEFVSDVPKIDRLFVLPDTFKSNPPYIVIFPGASWSPKMWPIDKFVDLINKLKRHKDIDLVLCGSKSEFDLCEEIIVKSRVVARNLAGSTNLQELIEVIRNASLVVANDTSAIHIAAATDTSAICLLGGGHFGRFLPYQLESKSFRKLPNIQIHKMDCYGCNWQCKYTQSSTETVPCIANISADSVYLKCANVLSNLTNSPINFTQ